MPGRTGRQLAAAAGIGVVAGLSSGLLGIGGGIVMVPAMTAVLLMPQRRAVANSLLSIVPISIAGVVVYYVAGPRPQVDLRLATVLLVGSVIGAPLGAALTYRIPERALRIGFGLLALLVATRLLIE